MAEKEHNINMILHLFYVKQLCPPIRKFSEMTDMTQYAYLGTKILNLLHYVSHQNV